jgi:TonB-dependent SusC/RagA subfamily outer membrane receptor
VPAPVRTKKIFPVLCNLPRFLILLKNIVMRKYILSATLGIVAALTIKAQMPQLTVDGKTNNGVHLQALKIEVKVCGTVARTTWQMTFKNTTSRILEGTLNFPLKDGLSVSRYALDINGKMREAVPVDRGKGTEVFEAIERRRVDPGLLEKVDGNTFRTRIYPINPGSSRTVLTGYEEELTLNTDAALRYYLPLNLKDTVADFSLDITVIQSALQPVFDSSLNENLQFGSSSNQYHASLQKNNYVPGHSLAFSIPKPRDAAEVMLQEYENKYCYLINTMLQKSERKKPLPGTVCLLWDASLSGTSRNTKKELELLDAYFKKINNAAINCTVFSNTIKSSGTFAVQNGNWDALKKMLQAVQYDGATNLGCLNLKSIAADEFILVSDGHQTAGSKEMEPGKKPVYCISSAVAADYSFLKYITGKTGGVLIDLQKETAAGALKLLTTEAFRFLGIKPNDFVKENYPSLPVAVSSSFAIAGMAEEGLQEITLQFGYGNKVTYEKNIAINTETQLCENFDITKVFAQKKIAELDIRYNENKQAIERTGRLFGVVTRNTSLIVLETVNDYIQYGIEPPAELRPEYERIMKQQGSDVMITSKEDELQNSVKMMTALKKWYNPEPVKPQPVAKANPAPPPPAPVQPSPTPAPPPPPARTPAPAPAAPAVAATPAPANPGLTPHPAGNAVLMGGKVTDENGNPVPFAAVKIKGSRAGVSADAEGNYTIRAKKGDVLEFSGTGFGSRETLIGNNATINSVLNSSANTLNEVVVVSYATRRKRDIPYSVQTISADRLDDVRVQNFDNALQGKVAGVQVRSQATGTPGAETAIRVRGESSIANAKILYVVDGTIAADISDIDEDDIEDMTILQAPAATALFGAEGANGAIVITTVDAEDAADKILVARIDSVKKVNKNAAGMHNDDYMQAIKQTAKAGRYQKYLELRQYYTSQPTYFFEAAGYFLKTGDRATGLTILSNLAELENGNYELYKMLGYKLKEAGDYDGELSAFKKVLELRPNDPQSFRDCALAHLDMGHYQQALDMLYEGLTRSYSAEMDGMYAGIEEIFLTEINCIIALHKKELKLNKIDRQLIAPMPADVRVVMNWNKNNTDIDLWVTDPSGEKCYYSHNKTAMGGRMSDDFTEGFGPEQYMLKTGAKGTYRIEINYYSDSQVTLSGPTTVMAEIYLHYGTEREVKKIITLQMEKGKQGQVFIGEVEL